MSVASERRIPELDGLRALAIALVLWHHLVDVFLPPGAGHWLGWVQVAGNLAWCGVDLFFVLSGFLIGGILIDHRDSPNLVRTFYLRRAVRILPLYYLTLGVCLVAVLVTGASPSFSPWVYGLFLTNVALLVQNHWDMLMFAVLWSIAVEEQFYLTAPWVVRAIPANRLPWLIGALIVSAILLRALVKWRLPQLDVGIHVFTPFRMDSLAWGALLAWAVRTPDVRPFFQRLAANWPLWLGAGIALLAGFAVNRPHPGDALSAYLGYTLINLVFTLLVALVVCVRPPALNRLLAWSPLVHLGRHSYFIYLWHALIGLGIIRWLGGPDFTLASLPAVAVVAVAIGATWAAAVVSWKFFESPWLKIGQRHSY